MTIDVKTRSSVRVYKSAVAFVSVFDGELNEPLKMGVWSFVWRQIIKDQ
jgi:hypothetical protein